MKEKLFLLFYSVNKKNSLLILIALPVFFLACDDVFEGDLSLEKLELLAPSDTLTTEINSLTFWWDILEDAQTYNLQIVTPSFTQIENLVMDTLIQTNRLTLSFSPGSYSWRVIARNGWSSSTSDTLSFIITDNQSTD